MGISSEQARKWLLQQDWGQGGWTAFPEWWFFDVDGKKEILLCFGERQAMIDWADALLNVFWVFEAEKLYYFCIDGNTNKQSGFDIAGIAYDPSEPQRPNAKNPEPANKYFATQRRKSWHPTKG